MKNSIRILLCGLFLLVAGLVGAAVAPEPSLLLPEPSMLVNNMQVRPAEVVFLMSAPAIVSVSITQQLIDDMKLKYGSIKLITVVAEEAEKDESGAEVKAAEVYQFLVRRPNRAMIKMLLPLAEARKIDEFSEKAVQNLVIGGDVDKLDDGIVFMGVVSQLKGMIAPAQSFLSNA